MNPKEKVGFMGFSYWRNSTKKRNSKIQKRSDFGGFQSPEVRKFKKKKRGIIARFMYYLVFIV
jgi:hypothetical protein